MTTHLLETVGLVLVICLFASQLKVQRRRPLYKQKSILTKNEVEFFWRLRSALPDAYIFPQVAMSALIEPKSNGKPRVADRNRISQKYVDFAIYTAGLELLAIVELDDRTHNKAADAQRDARLASAGIRTVRFQSRCKPDEREIRLALLQQ